ncbi:MAG: DUF2905 domain-containing protein [Verrucomicrobiota bacterium]
MQDLGKFMVIGGVVLALAGAWLWSGRGFGWLGKLPGDIAYQHGDFRFYFPLTTSILISVVLTLLAWFFRR